MKSFFLDRKIPVIPPLFVNNNFISDFKVKAELFNDFFSKQCSVIANNSTLPMESLSLCQSSLFSIECNADDVLKLIRLLNPNKSHGHDNISVKMLKLCDTSIVKPLLIIFNNCLKEGVFPLLWKKANIIPIHKKRSKNDLNNYRPISLLPICGKLLEKIIYNSLYSFMEKNNLLSVNQSGFRAGDSCTNQLLSITHDIFHSFDANPSLEVRGVFLDMSKAFDRVWHDGLLYKLKCNGIQGNVYNLLSSFLSNRYQRVLLNGQSSNWAKISAGVPQGSILGPLLFLVYISDISLNLKSSVKLFADDTSLFSVVVDPNISATTLNNDLVKIQNWAHQWKMSFNPDITKQATEVLFSRKRNNTNHPDLYFNNLKVSQVSSQKHLGFIFDTKLSFKDHIESVLDKVSRGINVLRKLRFHIPRSSLVTIYKSFIRSNLDFADVVYDQPNNSSFVNRIESLQYSACLAVTGAIRGTSKVKLYNELGLESLSNRRWYRRLSTFFNIFSKKSPLYLYELIPKQTHSINTRNYHNIPQIFCRTDFFLNSFFPYTIKEWNKLDNKIKELKSSALFRSSLLKSIRPQPNSVFNLCDPLGLKLLTRLRVGLSHLREHKFHHNFLNTLNPLCPCNLEIESVSHFFMRCSFYTNERTLLMNELLKIDPNIHLLDDLSISNLLLLY